MKKIFNDVNETKEFLPQDKTFTLIGGAFDILHVGHINVLKYASTLEDLLVVAALSDEFIRKYKGPDRPIMSEKQRVTLLASLSCVDMVYVSDIEPNSAENLGFLRPSSVVYSNEVANNEKVKSWMDNIKSYSPNTKIKLWPRYDEEDVSTSSIIKKIQDL